MKPRSPRFPFISLEEAVELLRKLDSFQGDPSQPLKRPEILKALDYASLHGAAVKTIGALRAYDLLEKQGEGLRITEVGRGILSASTDEERTGFLQRAALSPLMFRQIWRNARHCSRPELKELLLGRGFTEPGAKRASRIYRKNDRFADLASLELEPVLPERGPGKNRKGLDRQVRPGRAAAAPSNQLRLPLSAGTAIIPKGISEEEFTVLMQTLRTWKDQLVA